MLDKEEILLVVATLRRVADALEREASGGGAPTPVTDALLRPKTSQKSAPQNVPDDPLSELRRMWTIFSDVFAGKLGKSWRSKDWVVALFTGTEEEGRALRAEAQRRGVRKVFMRDGKVGFRAPSGSGELVPPYQPSNRLPEGYFCPHDDDPEVGPPTFSGQTGEHDLW